MLLFKYVSPDAAPWVFENADELSIRFGLPRTYNDPYELFLQPDTPLESKSSEHSMTTFSEKSLRLLWPASPGVQIP